MRAIAGWALTMPSPEQWDKIGRILKKGLPASIHMPTLGEKVHKLAAVLDSDSQTELYWRLMSLQREADSLVIGAQDRPTWADAQAQQQGDRHFSEEMMFEEAARLSPSDHTIQIYKGWMYEETGKEREAAAAYRRALEIILGLDQAPDSAATKTP